MARKRRSAEECEKMYADMKKSLEDALHKIGWRLSHSGCDHFAIIDHEGKNCGMQLYCGKVQPFSSENFGFHFALDQCEIVVFERDGRADCVSIKPKRDPKFSCSMIQFYNHGR